MELVGAPSSHASMFVRNYIYRLMCKSMSRFLQNFYDNIDYEVRVGWSVQLPTVTTVLLLVVRVEFRT